MTLAFLILALPGLAAVLLRFGHALFGTVRHSVERIVAGQIADSRGQRGDISGMAEAEAYRKTCAKQQLHSAGQLVLWSAAIFAPLLMPGTFIIYVLYGVLWLLPRPKAKSST